MASGAAERFEPFGVAHAATLGVVLVTSALLTAIARRMPERGAALKAALAAEVLVTGVGFIAVELALGTPWRVVVPLHLCDVAVFLAAVALLRGSQLAFELLYFWGGVGTLLALFTPEIAEAFPHHRFVLFFAQHGGIVAAVVVLAFGFRMRPRARAPLVALAILNVYALFVAAFNVACDTNFLYLMHKPGNATPLDWLGPWPWYIASCELIALGGFALLMLPFRDEGAGRGVA